MRRNNTDDDELLQPKKRQVIPLPPLTKVKEERFAEVIEALRVLCEEKKLRQAGIILIAHTLDRQWCKNANGKVKPENLSRYLREMSERGLIEAVVVGHNQFNYRLKTNE